MSETPETSSPPPVDPVPTPLVVTEVQPPVVPQEPPPIAQPPVTVQPELGAPQPLPDTRNFLQKYPGLLIVAAVILVGLGVYGLFLLLSGRGGNETPTIPVTSTATTTTSTGTTSSAVPSLTITTTATTPISTNFPRLPGA